MASRNRIKVFVEYIPEDGNGEVNYNTTASSFPQGNSISSNNLSNDLKMLHIGAKPFMWGVSSWQNPNNEFYWSHTNKYNGFMSKTVYRNSSWGNGRWWDNNDNGDRPITWSSTANPTIIIIGTDIVSFQINFDTDAQQWATKMRVSTDSGTTWMPFENASPMFIWGSTNPTNSVIVEFQELNIENYSIRITSISIGLTVEYGDEDIDVGNGGVQVSNNVSNNPDHFESGMFVQNGRIALIDHYRDIQCLDSLGVLRDRVNVRVELLGNTVFKGINERWDFEHGNALIATELTDPLIAWDSVPFSGVGSDDNNTMLSFFNGWNDPNQTGFNPNVDSLCSMSPEEIHISLEDRQYIYTIKLPDGHLPASSLSIAWDGWFLKLMDLSRRQNGEIWCERK